MVRFFFYLQLQLWFCIESRNPVSFLFSIIDYFISSLTSSTAISYLTYFVFLIIQKIDLFCIVVYVEYFIFESQCRFFSLP